MDIREAFNTIVSALRADDGNFNFGHASTYVVKRKNLTAYGWRVLEAAADAEADYLDESTGMIIAVAHCDDGAYLIRYRPFVWEPHNQYGFSCKLFNYIFNKHDPQLVDACVKVAVENDGMLYSEVKDTNGIRRCHYGVRVYNNRTGEWDGVYEGTFPIKP